MDQSVLSSPWTQYVVGVHGLGVSVFGSPFVGSMFQSFILYFFKLNSPHTTTIIRLRLVNIGEYLTCSYN